MSFPYGGFKFKYSSRRINILLLYTDCRDGRNAAIARHVSLAQITCLSFFSSSYTVATALGFSQEVEQIRANVFIQRLRFLFLTRF